MPKRITQYKVFIGSPGGLEEERKVFKEFVDRCSDHHGLARNVLFSPVGWEETLGGAGRPQALINDDLKQCDYAIFILHDRWGSPTGTHGSGFEEEFALAEELNRQGKLLGYFLFLKPIDPAKLADPGDQLRNVVAFRERVRAERKLLYKEFADIRALEGLLDSHLAQWLRDHEARESGELLQPPQTDIQAMTGVSGVASTEAGSKPSDPGFDFWYQQSSALLSEGGDQAAPGLFFAKQALARARNDVEVVRALRRCSDFQFFSGRLDDALTTCAEIISRFGATTEPSMQRHVAGALGNKGAVLGALGRVDEEIAAYDELLSRFSLATERALREEVARALVNKGGALSTLGRRDEAIAVNNDLLDRFSEEPEAAFQQYVSRALFNKGVNLVALDRRDEGIAVYDDLVVRFGGATQLASQVRVAKALVNKGSALGGASRNAEAIAVYDEVLGRFGASAEPALAEPVIKALLSKGLRLNLLGRRKEALKVAEGLLARFGGAAEPELMDVVDHAKTLRDQLTRSPLNPSPFPSG